MPIYEYRCQSCDLVMEAFVRGGKEPTACKECGAESLTRLISRAGVIFKGSGFYVNDSKGSSSTASTSSASETPKKEATASGDKKSSDSASSKSASSSSSSTKSSTESS